MVDNLDALSSPWTGRRTAGRLFLARTPRAAAVLRLLWLLFPVHRINSGYRAPIQPQGDMQIKA